VRTANAASAAINADWPGFASSTPTRLALWNSPKIETKAIVLAANAVVATVSNWTSRDPYDAKTWRWSLLMLDRNTYDTLWHQNLPSMPMHNGLALGRNGEIVVTLQSGAVQCYGTGPVSVAGRSAPMPAVAAPAGSARAETWSANVPVAPAPAYRDPVQVASAVPLQQGIQSGSRICSASLPVADGNPAAPSRVYQDACSASPEDFAAMHPDLAPESAYEHHDMTWRSATPCLKVVGAAASSATGSNGAGNTVDADLRTRWAGGTGRGQWLVYDLGTQRDMSGVTLVWYSRSLAPVSLAVAVSPDGRAFETVDEGTLHGFGSSTALRSFVPQAGRYLRLTFDNGGSGVLPSIVEVGIHGLQ
jgi:hypothetical protein